MFASSLSTFVYAEDFVPEQTGGSIIQKEFYVATNGNDSNDGTEQKPFATVEKARQAVDRINDSMTGNIVVNIGAGEYYISGEKLFKRKGDQLQ